MTSLSEQLKRLRAPQTAALKGNAQRSSLLFDRSDAQSHDTETVFALGKKRFDFIDTRQGRFVLGVHGFKGLLKLDQGFDEFQATLFNESSANIERSVLSKEENEKLRRTVQKFLFRLSPYFLLTAAHQALEWLIFK